MHHKNYEKFISQIDLPFLEAKEIYLHGIFKTLEREFDLKKDSKQIFMDLGAGNGRVVIFSALNFGIKSIGIEIDPILIKEAKESIKSLCKDKSLKKHITRKIKIIHGDFYEHNLKDYDFIYIYSLPTMQKYLKHVFQTAKRGVIIISHMYPLKNLTQYLEFMTKLEHNKENQEISTYFYRRI